MQPTTATTDIDPGLVDVDHRLAGQRLFDPELEEGQAGKGVLVEIDHGPGADRHVHLLEKMFCDAVVWHRLVLGHVDRLDLDADPVLQGPRNPFRERRHVAFSPGVKEDLGAPFGHHRGDVQIDDLPPFVTDHPVLARGQGLDNRSIKEVLHAIVPEYQPDFSVT